MTKKIWIDLTDIQHWEGQHGGVQRVVYGIASSYFKNKSNNNNEVGFFVFEAKDKCFYEIDFGPIYNRVEAARESSVTQNSDTNSLEQIIKKKYKKYIPVRILEHAPTRNIAKKAGKKGIAVVRRSKKALSSASRKDKSITQPRIEFTDNDIVLILGKPWDDLNIQRTLTKMKLKTKFKLVQVVYDMIIPLYPHLHHTSLFTQYTQHMFEVIAASDLLLPISKSTDKDLKIFSKELRLEVPNTKVIRLGDDINGDRLHHHDNKPSDRIKHKFMLCVGTVEIRKNHTLLYYVYKLAEERGVNLPQLVIVGGGGWLSHDIQYLINNDPKIKSKIIILNNVSDTGLDWLYRECSFTIYPSMYEGWGLPIAESLSYGKVCIASNKSSMTEIAGDLIDYFSPYDANDCLNKILVYTEAEKITKKEALIKKSYVPTKWQTTYDQVQDYVSSIEA